MILISRDKVRKTLKAAGFAPARKSNSGSRQIVADGFRVNYGPTPGYIIVESSYKYKPLNNDLVRQYKRALINAGLNVFEHTTDETNYIVGKGFNYITVQYKPNGIGQ